MSTFYVCRINHPNDQVLADNVVEYLLREGVDCRLIELGPKGFRPELQQCLRDPDAIGALGLNSQLDRSWSSEGTSFLDEAAARRLPVVQWILDHASARWPQFTKSTATNSAYLFLSAHNESYFRRFIHPDALTASTFGPGINRRARAAPVSEPAFLERNINCLIPINITRVGNEAESVLQKLEHLRAEQPDLYEAVSMSIEAARFDLINPLEDLLLPVLKARKLKVTPEVFGACIKMVDDATQDWRRRYVLETARSHQVLIDTDIALPALATGAAATFINDSNMPRSIARMHASRAVVSVSNLADLMHDRTLNGMTAGCVNIVEDNVVHRSVFRHGVDALLFRYDDDSLRECLDLVCNDPRWAYRIAVAGQALGDRRPFRLGGFEKIVDLAQAQRARSRRLAAFRPLPEAAAETSRAA